MRVYYRYITIYYYNIIYHYYTAVTPYDGGTHAHTRTHTSARGQTFAGADGRGRNTADDLNIERARTRMCVNHEYRVRAWRQQRRRRRAQGIPSLCTYVRL